MTSENTHTPPPYSIGSRTNFYKVDGSSNEFAILRAIGKDRFEAISIGNSKGQICLVPLDESSRETAEFIVRACNAHEELVGLVREMNIIVGAIRADRKPDADIMDNWAKRCPVALDKARGA